MCVAPAAWCKVAATASSYSVGGESAIETLECRDAGVWGASCAKASGWLCLRKREGKGDEECGAGPGQAEEAPRFKAHQRNTSPAQAG
jgi:hypothetical protein